MLQDLRAAFRLLRTAPGFTAAALVTLALGIGANAAIFSVVDGVLLRPAPVADLDSLVLVWETDRNTGTTREPASVPDFLDFAQRSRTLRQLTAIMGREMNASHAGGEPERLAALAVSHDFLGMLGIEPLAGRHVSADEDRAAGPRVVLISESLWSRSYHRSPDVVGRVLRLDEVPHTIVGVVPDVSDFGVLQVLSAAAYSRGFADGGGRTEVDVWLPLQPDPRTLPRETHPIFMIGRLARGASVASAQQELASVAAELERTHRENAGRGVFVEPMSRVVFGAARPALYVLLGAVLLVLLVSCVNVANLLLARGTTRVREVAVRAALGAGSGRLARQFLLENLVLTGLAAAAGIALAVAGLRVLLAIAPAGVPRLSSVSLDLRVLGATLSVSVVVALVFGLLPTWQARRLDLQDALRGGTGSRGTGLREHVRLRSVLVVAQLALAVVLVVGAGLLARSFWQLLQVDAGFQAAGVLKAEYRLPETRYPVDFRRWPDFAEMHAFTAALTERVSVLPGVRSVAIAGNHPLDPGFTNSFAVVGRESEAADWPEISVRRVTPTYFATVGLRLQRGRLPSETDSTRAAPVLVINETAARRFFGDTDPIGARVRLWGAARTIVGIVGNERFQGLTEAPPIAVYLPLAQAPSANGAGVLLVRGDGDVLALAPQVRRAIRAIDRELAVFGVEPLVETRARSVGRQRFTMLLIAVFAALALGLAGVGVHGVLSYAVAQRTREIGIRVALGARPARVLRLVLGQGLRLAAWGIALGLGGALAFSRVLRSLLFGVTPDDPLTMVSVAGVLGAVALVAAYVPARRALRVNPAVALRSE
jgi:predicted permease